MSYDRFQSCDPYWEVLSAMADGEASPEEVAEVKEHLATCRACAEAFAYLEQTSFALAETPMVEPPAELRSSILAVTTQRVGVLERVRAAFAGYRVSLATAAAVAVIGYVAYRWLPVAPPVELAETPDEPVIGEPMAGGSGDTGGGFRVIREPENATAAESRPRSHNTALAEPPVPSLRVVEHRAPGFIGANTMLASIPFDLSEPAMAYKPIQSSEAVTSDEHGSLSDLGAVETVVINVTSVRPEKPATGTSGSSAKEDAAPKDEALLEAGKARFVMAFERENLLDKLEQKGHKRGDDGDGLTLIKGKF